MKKVAIIMGSRSDSGIVSKASTVLQELHIPYETHILSAHRTPDQLAAFAGEARAKGFGVLICAAGKAAHLAGAVAARTTLPVIGIPIVCPPLGGLDALLATVQMPSGIPVATTALDGAQNAALLAAEILAVSDDTLAAALDARRQAGANAVLADDDALQNASAEA